MPLSLLVNHQEDETKNPPEMQMETESRKNKTSSKDCFVAAKRFNFHRARKKPVIVLPTTEKTKRLK